MNQIIDLRSDTVTQPTPSMRRAMASAEVGDDVYGEDPTVNRLEARAAEILEREAALFVPTGTMGNQIAVHVHTVPGSEVIGESGTHVFNFEMGAMAALSGALPRAIPTSDGILDPDQVAAAIQPKALYRTPTRLLVLENTHNLAGGRVVPLERMRELVAVAKAQGLAVHLDGARIHNAAAASGVSAAELARGCDTVMFCLSKGLAAPVGSVLVGDADTIREARRIRKLFGGGMRQAGVLAAAGLVALDEMLPRLADDHATARRLAELISDAPHVELDLQAIETNIVFFALEKAAPISAGDLVSRLREKGILANALGPRRIRMVTHYEISKADAELAGRTVCELLRTVG